MDPVIAAVIAGLGTSSVSAVVAIMTMVWKMGQGQAQARERHRALCQRLDAFIERADETMSDAHKRIDRILEQ